MPKPRLLIILNRLAIGGPASNTLALASLLSNEFDILLVAGEPLPDEQSASFLLDRYKGFRVEIIRSFKRAVLPTQDVSAYLRLRHIIKEFQPQIIHTHGSKPGVLGRLAARQLKVPVIVHTYHGHVFHSYFNSFISSLIIQLERKLAGISTALIAINEKLKQELTAVYKIATSEKVVLNQLGIDSHQLQLNREQHRSAFRSEFQLGNQELAIGIIGRLVPIKQHRLFIELVEALLKEETNIPLRFFIIGDGEEKKNLKELLNAKQISFTEDKNNPKAIVTFTSWRTDIDVVLAGLDMVVLTSLNEGTPVSILEAMSVGRPVVATNVGGITELFSRSGAGFVCDSLADMVQRVLLLIRNPELRNEMGRAGEQYAEANLSVSKQAEELAAVYRKKAGLH